MRALRIAPLLLLAFSPATPAAAQDSDEAKWRAELVEIKGVYEQALAQNKLELMKPYLSPEFTMVTLTDDRLASFEEMESYWAGIRDLMGEGGTYTTKLTHQPSTFIGNTALMTGQSDDTVVTGSGQRFEYQSNWTAFGERIDGQWKIHRIHASIDPLENPFVQAEKRALTFLSLGIGVAIGTIAGALVGFLFGRKKRAG